MTSYDARTALLVVDVQNDFADPAGAPAVPGGDHIIAAVDHQVDAAQAGGSLVVYSQDWHPPHTPHFAVDGGIWPVHCVKETWGSAFHPELTVIEDAPVIRKGAGGEDGYSAFSVRDPGSGESWETELGRLLSERGIQRVVIVGLATDYCVVETAADARTMGFGVDVVTDAVRAVNLKPEDGEQALRRIRELDGNLI